MSAPLILGFFLLPYLILFVRINQWTVPHWGEFFTVFAYTSVQSLWSATLCLAIGVFGACGILRIKNRFWRRFWELIFVLPSVFPSLYIIVAALNLVTPFYVFPFGIVGVIIVHVLMNVGLVSVAMAQLFQQKLGGIIELATIEGASPWQIRVECLRALRRDLFTLGFFVFALSFTSFAIPLIVGGKSGETIEVLIYRAIFASPDIGYALSLSFIQSLFIFLLILPLSGEVQRLQRVHHFRYLRKIASIWGFLILFLLTTAIVVSSFAGVTRGWELLLQNETLLQSLGQSFWGTLCFSLSVGVITFFLLVWLLYAWPNVLLKKFFSAFISPAVVLVGLAIYLTIDTQSLDLILLAVVFAAGFALFTFPSLFRMRGESTLQALVSQMEMARVMSASRWQVLTQMALPQVWGELIFLSGVAAFWASGDFAFSHIFIGKPVTLAMVAQSLLQGYRLEVATLVMWFALLVGALVFTIFEVIGFVGHKRFIS